VKEDVLMQQRRQKRPQTSQQQMITKAVSHIRLGEANRGKLGALDELAQVYLALCQHYVTYFCTEALPDKFHPPVFKTLLSERWQRVAIQQAAGIAQSWRTNRERAYQVYSDDLLEYHDRQLKGTPDEPEPTWQEWTIPVLRQPCIQANVNVVALEASHDSTFEYWLRISILERHHPIRLPVKLSDYHREVLAGKTINSSVRLNKRNHVWWLTLTYDEVVSVQTDPDTPVVGIDVGIANFLTTSTGKHYGTFHGKLRGRQKRDREKRRRKANVPLTSRIFQSKLPGEQPNEGCRPLLS